MTDVSCPKPSTHTCLRPRAAFTPLSVSVCDETLIHCDVEAAGLRCRPPRQPAQLHTKAPRAALTSRLSAIPSPPAPSVSSSTQMEDVRGAEAVSPPSDSLDSESQQSRNDKAQQPRASIRCGRAEILSFLLRQPCSKKKKAEK